MALSKSWRTRYLFYASLILIIPFLLSVLDLHRDGISDGPKRKIPKKSDHLILGPAAGQGLPNRLQCKGLKAVNMDDASRSRGAISGSDAVSFVTVFTVYNGSVRSEPTSLVTVGNVSYSKEERSLAILHTFVDFIQVSMPKSSVIILTDPASHFSVKRNSASLLPIEGDYSRGRLMLQRIKSYIVFLHSRLEQLQKAKSVSHYVFTDSDVAVVDDLGHIFQKYPQFHLALTFRNNKEQPLNSGFIAVRGTPDGILKAKIFLQEVLDVYVSKYMKASRMLGDQLALASVVKAHLPFVAKKFGKPEAFSSEVNGVSVLFLPCAVYNWTPPEGAGQFHGMPLDVQHGIRAKLSIL
ncbi:uncharacterized protein LOC109828167 isoform X2 [Asparagus officinalis]|uniref:uncharacterized protein LOC109828167 isoform X2 n=1 Tax=Asparagus officinalis TaxID=4686 RepID=UPI00098E2B07|nr:uncharacterized protein LOC109828167 isoform X2 [Asparagus officinalis]